MMKKINLVLGGGGAAGIASVGVILELLAAGYTIPSITGTSAGALLGGLYSTYKESGDKTKTASKYLYDIISEDFEQFKDRNYFNFLQFYVKKLFYPVNFSSFGIYKGDALHDQLLNKTDYLTFSDLKKTNLYITACEATTGTLIVFSKHTTPNIRIADAIRASCSIQGVFKPFKIKARSVVNGIFIDNSINMPYDCNINKSHPLTLAIDKDDYLYLQDGGNLGNMRLDIADTLVADSTNSLMIGVSYTYNSELNNMNQANSILSQTINIMMNASEDLIYKYVQTNAKYNKTVVVSPKSGVGATDFEISMEKKLELVDLGRKLIREITV